MNGAQLLTFLGIAGGPIVLGLIARAFGVKPRN